MRNVQALQLYLLFENITSDYAPVFKRIFAELKESLRVFLLVAMNVADQVLEAITANEHLEYALIGQHVENDASQLSARLSMDWVSGKMLVLGVEWTNICLKDTEQGNALSLTSTNLKSPTYQHEKMNDLFKELLTSYTGLINARFFFVEFEIVVRRIEKKPTVEFILKSPVACRLVVKLLHQHKYVNEFRYALHLLKGSKPVIYADLLELMHNDKIDILQIDGLKYFDSIFKGVVIDANAQYLKWLKSVKIISVLVDVDEDDEDVIQYQILLDRISFICNKLEFTFLRKKEPLNEIQSHPRFIKEADTMPCCTKLGLINDTLPGGICLKIQRGSELAEGAWLKTYWTRE